MKNIFRKEALEQMGTTGENNSLVKVVTTPGWLALLGFAILLVVTLFWAIFGRIGTKVSGQGIVINKGGIFNIVSTGSGQIIKLNIKEHDHVKKGEVIAVISQPELQEKIEVMTQQLNKLKDDLAKTDSISEKSYNAKKIYLVKQEKIDTKKIQNMKKRLRFIDSQLTSQKGLLNKGLITFDQYEELKQQDRDVQINIQQTQSQFDQHEYDQLQLQSQQEKENRQNENQIEDLSRQLKILHSKYNIASKVVSTFQGTVVELKVYEGSTVSEGMAVASIELKHTFLQAIVYLSPFDGKKVKENMNVQIIPSTVSKEEHGYIKGVVNRVSKFPLTSTAINATLENSGLTSLFTKSGPPIAVTVKLDTDTTTGNFIWSTPASSNIVITPGTLCSSQITIRKQSPISLVLPYLKKIL